MYAPTSLSVEGLFYVDDACPMRFDVVAEDTYLEFGAANLALSLMCSDQALINLARLANKAVRAGSVAYCLISRAVYASASRRSLL
jgi:hypothetical protein